MYAIYSFRITGFVTEFLKDSYRANKYDKSNNYAWPPMKTHHYKF